MREIKLQPASGGLILTIFIIVMLAIIAAVFVTAVRENEVPGALGVALVLGALATPLVIRGLVVVGPNEGRALVLFGNYRGTIRESGFFWTHPFAARHKVSLKAVNISSNTIKVNDLAGNPIEIAAVVVYRVHDTAQALFAVEDYRTYTDVQIETAVRRLASVHPYDDSEGEGEKITLRGDSEQVATELETELQERLDRAGIKVIEARISHLAYAPEIASSMLQRQQASALIGARRKIVEGAVGMVEDALTQLEQRGMVELDDERKATLVGNLLVVLCGQQDAQPIINTGTLYN
ncbi:SPFH domain-containing protein [bacterium]|nr:MAG: SPFH domain-containing protein [bacterium]RKZ17849.1 MAG: SPFH domain-containing protein [bacterium]